MKTKAEHPSVTRFYHGTSHAAAKAIRKHGLLPRASTGADSWVIQTQPKKIAAAYLARPASVFVTESSVEANMFAAYAATMAHESNGVIVELDLTAFRDLLVPDERSDRKSDGTPGNWRIEQALPASCVVAIREAQTELGAFLRALQAAGLSA